MHKIKGRLSVKTLTQLLLFILLFQQSGCSMLNKNSGAVIHIPVPGSQSEISEIDLGAQIHNVITASQYLYTKPEVVNYVTEVGRSLARYSLRPHLPYSFTILVDERLYSTAAPGGYIYLTTGLLNFMKNEAELAGILAHEIGEVQHQPAAVSILKKHSEDLAALTALVGSFFGPIGAVSAAGAILLTNSPYGDIGEGELLIDADQLAVNMLAKSHYNPAAFRNALLRVEETFHGSEQQGLALEWDRKRPIRIERLQKLDNLISQIKLDPMSLQTDSSRFTQAMKSIYAMYPAH